MLRLFAGLELPPGTRQALAELRSDLKGARWQTASQFHLTLCFMGNLDDERLPAIYDALNGLEVQPFTITVRGVGLFGSNQHPKNLWANIANADPVLALQDRVRSRLAPLELDLQERPFQPHITLARFRWRRTRQHSVRQDRKQVASGITDFLARHENATLPPFEVNHVSLFNSTRRPDGSHYQVIGRFPAN